MTLELAWHSCQTLIPTLAPPALQAKRDEAAPNVILSRSEASQAGDPTLICSSVWTTIEVLLNEDVGVKTRADAKFAIHRNRRR